MSARLFRRSSPEWLAGALLVLTAAGWAFGVLWRQSARGATVPAYDFYALFYPNLVHAGRSLLAGGEGLLWNPYQACGQPFFANSQVGLLYPANVLFALLPREPALIADIILHLAIAGGGMLLFGRALGFGVPAALCAALAFQLNWATLFLASASPIHITTFAWLPVALWRTERLVQAPHARTVLALALVLTLQLLPGFYQIGFYTYQLIALRLLAALLLRQAAPRVLLPRAALAVTLPLLLAAVQLVPAIELARTSIRTLPLNAFDLGPGFTWASLPARLHEDLTAPGTLLVLGFALLALLVPRPGRAWLVGGVAAVAALYFVLSLGPGTPLYALYELLPFGRAFRLAARLRWVTSFALATLVGAAVDALLRAAPPPRRVLAAAVLLAAAALAALLLPDPPVAGVALLAGLAAAAVVAAAAPAVRPALAIALPLLLVLNGVVFGPPPIFGLVWGDVYGTHAALFDTVRTRMQPGQERMLTVGRYPGLDLTPKSATLFQLPGTYDYEAQTPRHYADVFTVMRTGAPLQQLSDWHWLFRKLLAEPLRRPLFDLLATRYLFVVREFDRTAAVLPGGMERIAGDAGVVVYENTQALPRARWVPQLAVVPSDAMLSRLASGADDLRAVALVSAPPPSGFHGAPAAAPGTAAIVVDRPEHVAVRVHAPQPGFLFLADEDFPGWQAAVDGEPRPILRANHAFRLVEVPAGTSTVTFTYRPRSLWLGAAISAATLLLLGLAAWRARGAARARRPEPGDA